MHTKEDRKKLKYLRRLLTVILILCAFAASALFFTEQAGASGQETGDYRIIYKDGYMPPVTVERKACIDELIGNILDNRKDESGNNRFVREILRAKEEGLKFYLLIQDKDYYKKLITGRYLSRVNKNAISGMIMSLTAKYPWVHIVACDREISPSMVHKILYYELREKLK